jgi:transcriptional regulator with XRE-family HTH domain
MKKVVYNRIKIALLERQKTGKWLGEKLGKSDVTISRWTSNNSQPSIETLYAIAEILNMDARDLLIPVNTSCKYPKEYI